MRLRNGGRRTNAPRRNRAGRTPGSKRPRQSPAARLTPIWARITSAAGSRPAKSRAGTTSAAAPTTSAKAANSRVWPERTARAGAAQSAAATVKCRGFERHRARTGSLDHQAPSRLRSRLGCGSAIPTGAGGAKAGWQGGGPLRAAIARNADRHARDLAPVVADIRSGGRRASGRSPASLMPGHAHPARRALARLDGDESPRPARGAAMPQSRLMSLVEAVTNVAVGTASR